MSPLDFFPVEIWIRVVEAGALTLKDVANLRLTSIEFSGMNLARWCEEATKPQKSIRMLVYPNMSMLHFEWCERATTTVLKRSRVLKFTAPMCRKNGGVKTVLFDCEVLNTKTLLSELAFRIPKKCTDVDADFEKYVYLRDGRPILQRADRFGRVGGPISFHAIKGIETVHISDNKIALKYKKSIHIFDLRSKQKIMRVAFNCEIREYVLGSSMECIIATIQTKNNHTKFFKADDHCSMRLLVRKSAHCKNLVLVGSCLFWIEDNQFVCRRDGRGHIERFELEAQSIRWAQVHLFCGCFFVILATEVELIVHAIRNKRTRRTLTMDGDFLQGAAVCNFRVLVTAQTDETEIELRSIPLLGHFKLNYMT